MNAPYFDRCLDTLLNYLSEAKAQNPIKYQALGLDQYPDLIHSLRDDFEVWFTREQARMDELTQLDAGLQIDARYAMNEVDENGMADLWRRYRELRRPILTGCRNVHLGL